LAGESKIEGKENKKKQDKEAGIGGMRHEYSRDSQIVVTPGYSAPKSRRKATEDGRLSKRHPLLINSL
jgi:hypothetical protein